MQVNLYMLDGKMRSRLMGQYNTQAEAETAQREFQKTYRASWLISTNEAEPMPDGTTLSMGVRV